MPATSWPRIIGFAQAHRAEAAMIVIMQVRTADAAGFDRDLDLPGAGDAPARVSSIRRSFAAWMTMAFISGPSQRPALASGLTGEMGREIVAHQLAHGLAGLDRAGAMMRLQHDIVKASGSARRSSARSRNTSSPAPLIARGIPAQRAAPSSSTVVPREMLIRMPSGPSASSTSALTMLHGRLRRRPA